MHSYAKTTFDPWHQDTWDTADTVLLDPRDDPDVRGYTGRYLDGWARSPAAGRPGTPAVSAARSDLRSGPRSRPSRARGRRRRAAGLDTLGRTFLTVTHNRVLRRRTAWRTSTVRARNLLDIQGNEHEVRDALGRAVMRYDFTMLGAQVTHDGMDTGGARCCPTSRASPCT